MDDETTRPGADGSGSATPDETFSWSDTPTEDAAPADETGRSATAREWLTQLQGMIDNLATAAAPVMREIGAKAAELAAAAGERAGPFAAKAAEATASAGSKVAERGREVAAELRRDAGKGDAASNSNGSDAPKPIAAGSATDAPAGTVSDSPDSPRE